MTPPQKRGYTKEIQINRDLQCGDLAGTDPFPDSLEPDQGIPEGDNPIMPTATVKYTLSPAGQKAALIAGMDAKADQIATIDVPADAVELFTISQDGNLRAEAQTAAKWGNYGWLRHQFDAPQTGAEIIAFLRDREAARAIVTAEREQSARAKAEIDAQSETDRRARAIRMLRDRTEMAAWTIYSNIVGISVDGKRLEFKDSDPECGADVAAVIAEKKAAEEIAAKHAANLAALPSLPTKYPEPTLQVDGSFATKIPFPQGDNWSKKISSIDLGQQNGMAFEGPWLKCGATCTLALGDVVVTGGKWWEGSRRGGGYQKSRDLYVATAVGLLPVGGNTAAIAAELLTLTPEERVIRVITRQLATCDNILAKFAAIDPESLADVNEEATVRLAAWTQLKTRTEAALVQASEEPAIEDIPAAAAAIIAAGYKALSLTHHPDRGGNTATMALLTEARGQLRELLAMASEVSA